MRIAAILQRPFDLQGDGLQGRRSRDLANEPIFLFANPNRPLIKAWNA